MKLLNGTEMGGKTPSATLNVFDSTSLYIPLRFWFNRNPGLALPLIALQYHEVKIQLELNEISEVSFNGIKSNELYNDRFYGISYHKNKLGQFLLKLYTPPAKLVSAMEMVK